MLTYNLVKMAESLQEQLVNALVFVQLNLQVVIVKQVLHALQEVMDRYAKM